MRLLPLLLLPWLFSPGGAFALVHFRVALASPRPLSDRLRLVFCLRHFDAQSFNSSSNECQLGHAQIDFESAGEKAFSLEFAHFPTQQHFDFFIKVLRLRKNVSLAEELGDKEVLFRCSEHFHRSNGLSWQIFRANFSLRENNEPIESRNFSLDIRYRMDCGANFFGPNCDIRCQLTDWERRVGRFECGSEDGRKRCAKGWTGPNCDRSQTPPADSASPAPASSPCFCLNGGKCSSDGTLCICPPGFDGAHCEKCVTNNRCKGFCQLPGGCACPEGKGGQFCEKDLEFCVRHSPCQNGATCLNSPEGSYTCECPPGFGGRNCERRLTGCGERPCRNGARCVPQLMSNSVVGFRCECPRGFFGQFCQVRVRSGCADLPCQNGASCADSSSVPPSSPISASPPIPLRQRRVPPFLCLCANGWTGQICDQPLENCRVNSCQNGASCLIDPNSAFGFVCRCPHGWRGILCGEKDDVDECRTTKCQNGGTCERRANGFECICRKGFWGAKCQEKAEENRGEKVPREKERRASEDEEKREQNGPNCSAVLSPGLSDAVPSVSVPIALLLFFMLAFLFSLSTTFSASSPASSAVPSISTISQPKSIYDHRSPFASSDCANSETARYVCEPTFRIGPQSRRHLEERAMSAMEGRKAPPRTAAKELGRGRPRESPIYEEIDLC